MSKFKEIFLKNSPPDEKVREPLDGHVGDDEHAVELNAKGLPQLIPVLGLQFVLVGGQKCT